MKRQAALFQRLRHLSKHTMSQSSSHDAAEELGRLWTPSAQRKAKASPSTMDWWHSQSRVPAEVAKLVHEDGLSPTKAWRLHLKLTQTQVAARMGIATGTYWQLEKSGKPRKASRIKIAAALGITERQLDF